MGWSCAAWCQAAPDFGNARVSDDARYAADQVVDAADNQGFPFAIVDKRDARLYVFNAAGRLIGASAALLGSTAGDRSVPDAALHQPGQIAADERTTPAGRFRSRPGRNDKGEAIVWFDYEASLAIHRLRPAPAQERRPARLASSSPDDNRISLGCVVVPVDFYESVVQVVMGQGESVLYILPETRPAHALFEMLGMSARAD
ncbi:MAG TPA: L,D-transpeptidase [Caldimonas sp.]|nr:L,D-transpeptidase [Caldimonas sp.]